MTIEKKRVLLLLPNETDQQATADGSWGESGGRDRRAKASLRVDDKKELSEPPRGKERILKELKRISLKTPSKLGLEDRASALFFFG